MIKRRPLALEAVVEQALFIGETSPIQAQRFVDALEKTLHDLEKMPRMGRPYESVIPRLNGIRVCQVTGFQNHLIFYQETEGGIVFLHLLHAARDLDPALDGEL
jgi:plasmid stabilization system protein ParE